MSKMALCPRDGAPLICTMAWSKAEFYCLDCGGHFGWLEPRPGDPAENDERYQALLAEWEELGGPQLLGGGIMLNGCEMCRGDEPHLLHASPEEKAAHEAALLALAARAKKPVAT